MPQETALIRQETIEKAFTTGAGIDEAIAEVADIVRGYEHNLDTIAGRKKTASLAAKVSKTKVILENIGKEMVSEWKGKAKVVDANRKRLKDSFDELRDEARSPLTAWEAEQQALEDARRAAEEAENAASLLESDHEIAIIVNDKFDDDAEAAIIMAAQREEQRQAELRERIATEEKVNAQKAAADAIENAKRIEREASEAVQRAAEAEERAENQLIADKAKHEENERRWAAEKEAARVQAENDASEAAERARVNEVNRQLQQKADEAAELERRESNKRHVGSVRKKAKLCLMEIGLSEDDAKAVVLAINHGSIEGVTINY